MEERHELVQVRLDKIEKLKEIGINPYPYHYPVDSYTSDLLESFQDTDEPGKG